MLGAIIYCFINTQGLCAFFYHMHWHRAACLPFSASGTQQPLTEAIVPRGLWHGASRLQIRRANTTALCCSRTVSEAAARQSPFPNSLATCLQEKTNPILRVLASKENCPLPLSKSTQVAKGGGKCTPPAGYNSGCLRGQTFWLIWLRFQGVITQLLFIASWISQALKITFLMK